jgi:hypothetical protein
MKKVLVSLALSGMLSTVAYANGPINKREQIQRERIQQGVKNDALTRPEARRLHVEEAKLRVAEARVKRDGVVTPREALRVNRRLNAASRDIFRQKHDRQSR